MATRCFGRPNPAVAQWYIVRDCERVNCWHSCHIMAIRYDYRRRSTLQVPFCARTSPVGGLFESRKSHRERGLRMVRSALFGVKRIFFDRIFERSYWTWRRHPTIIVPSMLGTALSVIEQSIVTTGLIVFLGTLAMNGTLSGLLTQLSSRGLTLSLLQNSSYSSLLIPIAVISTIVVLLTAILGGGFVYSSEYGVYLEAWNKDKATIGSIVEHGSRNWKRMAWTLLLSNLITWGPLAAVFLALLASALNANSLAGLVGFAVSSNLIYPALAASLVIALFTVYSYPAVVIDNVSGLQAIRNSFRAAGRNLTATFSYSVVRVLFQFFLVLLVLMAGFIGLPLSSFGAAILSFLLTPILHSTKTMIYYYSKPEVQEMPFELSNPIWQDISRQLPRAAWRKIRAGLAEAGRFVIGPRNLPFHILSILAFVLGVSIGNYVSVNGVKNYLISIGYVPGQGNKSVVFPQVIPPVLGADIFLNNWLVSIATGLAGIGFGAPSFATILFNGFILGLLVPLSTLTMLLAAILPHGFIEIPSFILAGSIGIKLGYAGLRRFTGAERVADDPMSDVGIGPADSDGYLSRTLRQTV
ncbi:hypothetical protein E6H26_00995, partial [Candidatus Bathyarchaeota archaeon]